MLSDRIQYPTYQVSETMLNEKSETFRAKVEANKLARQAAQSFIEDLADQPIRFWEVFLEHIRCHFPELDHAMTEEEARAFENSIVPFGQYKNQPLKNVPNDYLEFLAGSDNWVNKLRKFLKTQTYRDRQS